MMRKMRMKATSGRKFDRSRDPWGDYDYDAKDNDDEEDEDEGDQWYYDE
eukprot:SAG31_NODE_545_length_14238_cov_15.518849_9_plen_49_part_00